MTWQEWVYQIARVEAMLDCGCCELALEAIQELQAPITYEHPLWDALEVLGASARRMRRAYRREQRARDREFAL